MTKVSNYLRYRWCKFSIALSVMLCMGCLAFAHLQRQSVKASPLTLNSEQVEQLESVKQTLPVQVNRLERTDNEFIPFNSAKRLSPAAQADIVDVPEVDIYASIMEDNKGTTMGIYSIPSTGGDFTHITYGPFAQNGGVYQDGYYFYSFADYYGGFRVYYSFLYDGNQKNWPSASNKNGEQNDARLCADAIANNPVDNKAYGCFYTANEKGYELGVLDIHEFTRSTICTLTEGWSAAGFTADGTLYVIDKSGNLATISLTDGSKHIIGATGLPISGPTSGTIDYRTNTFFYATNADGDHAMYVIDLNTAHATKLYDLPYQAKLGGMFIKYPNIDAGAPSAVANMELNFNNASLSGNVVFDAPSKTFGGQAITGPLSYEVRVNDVVLASGNCQAGAHTSAPISVNAPGNYSFEVSVKNNVGSSDPVKKTRWIGADMPAAPANVTLTMSGKNANLSWDAVTTGAHNGYVNPSEVTYTVTRMPENTEVAAGLTATNYSDKLEVSTATALYYEVKAVWNNTISEPAVSNTLTLGTIIPPYNETFDSENVLGTFTVIDANNDDNTWTFNFDKVQAKFNLTQDMDDWLITSPIHLEAGKYYDLTLDVRSHNAEYTPERFEVKLGSAPTVEAMTVSIIEPTDVTVPTYTRYAGRIKVAADGDYYVGIHGISPKDMYYMYVDNLSISAPYTGDTPGEATNFKIKPDYDGRTRGIVSFNAPALSTNGNPLTTPMDIAVSRNDQVVHTFGGIEPGAECSFEDIASEIGEYRYTIVATNSEGTGAIMTSTGRLGINLAPAPLNVKISETDEGTVKLTWDSPAQDINGNPLNPDVIHYAILDKTGQNVLAEDLKSTEWTWQVLEPNSGAQSFVFYYVLPQTAAGVNYDDYVYTDQIPVGTPYSYPFTESFTGGSLDKSWAISRLEMTSGSWGVGPSSQQPVAYPQDDDGGLAAFMPTQVGDEALLNSAKILVPASARNPKLSFWYYGVAGLNDRLDVMIYNAATGQFESIKSLTLSENGNGWHRVVCPLDEYKGQTIRIGFYGVCVSYSSLILIDNIKVTEVLDKNLSVESLKTPGRMTAGVSDIFYVTVTNNGLTDASQVELSLLRDGEPVASHTATKIEADSYLQFSFADAPDIFGADRVSYSAQLNWADDSDASDNTCAPVTVKVSTPALPRVLDLSAEETNEGVSLTWTAPTAGQDAAEMLESFENATSFAIDEVDGWTFVDRDGKNTYGIEDVKFNNMGKPMAYMVFDGKEAGIADEFDALSGSKLLVSFSNDDASACDNWAISPLLSGKPQTITFSAKAQTTNYGYEAFEFYYSTTDTNPDNFTKIAEDNRVGSTWKEYAYDVPQGAKYFAIRCVSKDAFAFMVDDVLFTPAGLPEHSAPTGYNVYRDKQKLNSDAVADNNHVAAAVDNDMHSYHVTALYPQGESAPSNEVRMAYSSLKAMINGDAFVYSRGGQIYCSGVSGKTVTIVNAAGVVIYSATSQSDIITVPAPAGAYIVTIDNLTYKIKN
ncbi:MAG: choice-of-anchor J domain-containing protein [Muribaculaceae bacterium]|nr:choice-of-anchor J domain-containing protein [Muribaculaceae bacterium]